MQCTCDHCQLIDHLLCGTIQRRDIVLSDRIGPVRKALVIDWLVRIHRPQIEFMHNRIVEERDKGTPVVIVSTELDEVAALADRVAVMYRGRIVGVVDGDTDREVLGLMMAGVPLADAQAQVASHQARSAARTEEDQT